MKLIPGNILKELIINNNNIVTLKNSHSGQVITEQYKEDHKYILLQFIHDGNMALAVCEQLNDQIYHGKREKGDIVVFKTTDIKFLYNK